MDDFLLKLDFEKAYDSISWECILDILEMFGFGDIWRSWIKLWLESGKVNVKVNDEVGREIACT